MLCQLSYRGDRHHPRRRGARPPSVVGPTVELVTTTAAPRALTPASAAFAIASLAHLVSLLPGMPEALNLATKAAIVPLLTAAVLAAVPGRRPPALLLAALGASFAGDLLLMLPDAFLGGVACFLVAQALYLSLLLPRTTGRPLLLPVALYLAAFAGLLALLGPSLGALLPALAVYGAVLCAMGAVAARGGLVLALGGASFVVSDALLAVAKFVPGWDRSAVHIVTMATYCAAQALLAWGVLRLDLRRARTAGRSAG
ncbi:hypothetical protein GCM10025874_25650 [Arenivirga flava]|uniref:Lysoplasmalogenase n=1 Tax=Arenivirga flava TaxID=1930060 RepID=A0AA37XD81_9MICO|nr:hypothetical protein GCM10025874_25650 [Arenivirga flava]